MELTRDYLSIPKRMIIELRDNPLALALYCWIARLYLIVQAPVPLSRSDVRMYDPSAKEGAVKRAFDRLISGGWLIESASYKSSYAPVWGTRRGTGVPYPWKVGADHLGCPRHIETIRVDRAILDVYIGRFRPHRRNPLTESYFSKPLLRLIDVGAYLLIAAGLPANDSTALQQWRLVREGAIQAIPDDAVIIALASQRASVADFTLTAEGWRKLGWGAARTSRQRQEAQQRAEAAPLIFMPKELIGTLIPRLIGESIGCAGSGEGGAAASGRAASAGAVPAPEITGTHEDSQESREFPPIPPGPVHHGGGNDSFRQQKTAQAGTLPDTVAAKLLLSFGINDPSSITDLAALPAEHVAAAITYARSEALGPGWVVTALRRQRDEGWPLPQPRKRADRETPICIEQYTGGTYGDLFMRGSDLSGLDATAIQAGHHDAQTGAAAAEAAHAEPGIATAAPKAAPDAPLERADDRFAEVAAAHTTLVCLWNRVLNTMQVQVSRHEFNTWIRRTSLVSVADGIATIGIPSTSLKEGFENRYTGAVRRLISDLYVPVSQVRVVIADTQARGGLHTSSALGN